jgi:hypothetical protein
MALYKPPVYDSPYHEHTYKHLLSEIQAASCYEPSDRYYTALSATARGYASNVLAFIDHLAREINARTTAKQTFAECADYVAECNRVIAEHTHWIARCKEISDTLVELDEFFGD